MPTIDNLDGYCNDIGAADATRMRVRSLIDLGQKFVGRKIEDIALEDQVNDEGVRQFQNIACFWPDGLYLDLPIPEPGWYASALHVDAVSAIRTTILKDYDFGEPRPDSRIEYEISWGSRQTFLGLGTIKLRATGNNCKYITDVVRKYHFPLLGK